MANTSILLKRSGLTGITPSSLNFGELALNYYDGKIYYKNASSVITSIGSVNSFANINANSTLILASSGSDTLALTANNGVSVVGNSGTKSINIGLITSGTSGNTMTSNGTSWVSSTLTLQNLPGAWTKKAADCATTAALTLNTAQATIDGIAITATTRVLVKNQATASQNGIYTGMSTTTWVRDTDAATSGNISGATISVDAGTTQFGQIWTNNFQHTDTLGTTSMNWYRILDTSMTLPIANGGTNSTATPTAGGIGYGTGTAHAYTGVGTSGQVLTSAGAGAPTWSSAAGTGTTASSSRLSYTATSGQTLFTTPTYVPGSSQLSVYISGVKQYPADYTETTGTSVTLTTGAVVGDTVLIEVNGYNLVSSWVSTPAVYLNTYTGNGSTTAFTLAQTPIIPSNIVLSINGITQLQSAYSLTGNTVTFTSAPLSGATIEGRVFGSGAIYANTIAGAVVLVSSSTCLSSTTGTLVVNNGVGVTGNVWADGVYSNGVVRGTTLVSNVSTGTAPFIVTSTTPVANLNVGGNAAGFPAAGVAEIGRYLDFHGASTGAADFDVRLDGGAGNGTTGSQALNVTASGGLICNANITAYSDIRLKENISIIPNAMNKLMLLRGVTFTRNDLPDTTTLHTGVIAQEVLAVLPEAVTQNHDGIYSVAYGNMVGLLIEAIKEQQSIITNLSNRLDALESK